MFASDARSRPIGGGDRHAAGANDWQPRRAAPVRAGDRALLGATAGFGVTGAVAFVDFWFRAEHVANPGMFCLLSLPLGFGLCRLVFSCFCHLGLRQPPEVAAPRGLRVAVFTTAAPGEPLAMFEPTLRALERMRYPHTTYLLDGTGDPAYRELAFQYGARWLDMTGVGGAKAGKVNRALELTDEDYVLVLDPDHIPFPEFLDRVLGHFADERVGFVQVAQAYYNQGRSGIARAAAEQTYGFYAATQMGLHGHGAAVAIGANCTFRRAALDSIGGHAVGLAEDLLTSLRLHASGWRSVYVPEVLSRGLAPEDARAYFEQQLKWAAGGVDLLLGELPRVMRRLDWRQRFAYASIGTYYGLGLGSASYLVLPYLALALGVVPARVQLADFASFAAPGLVAALALHVHGQRFFCDREREQGFHWRGMLLKHLCWPVYVAGAIRAAAGALVEYVPTRKQRGAAGAPAFLRPHALALLVFTAGAGGSVAWRLHTNTLPELWSSSERFWTMLAFAALSAAVTGCGLLWASDEQGPARADAWTEISRGEGGT